MRNKSGGGDAWGAYAVIVFSIEPCSSSHNNKNYK